MDWDYLRIFLAIDRAGSLRGAATALGVSHATIARGLEAAERALGTRLFDRSIRGMAATEPAEVLLPHALEIERNVLEIQRRISGLDSDPSGIVTVSLPPALGQGFFIPMLSAFSDQFSDIKIKVVSTNRFSDLTRQEADVSIRAAREVDDDIVGRRVVDCVNAAFATPSYIAKHPNIASSKGKGLHWIGWGQDDTWIANSPLPEATARHSLPDVFMQIEAAAAGLGIAWVVTFLADPHPNLVRVPNLPTAPDRSIWILLHGDLRNTARVRAFVDFASDWIVTRRKQFIS